MVKQDLAKEVFHCFSRKHLHESGHDSKNNSHVLSARVREIARDALKISEVDLDEFFEEEQPDKVSILGVIVIP